MSVIVKDKGCSQTTKNLPADYQSMELILEEQSRLCITRRLGQTLMPSKKCSLTIALDSESTTDFSRRSDHKDLYPRASTSLPYAQLCFDPATKKLISLTETNYLGERFRTLDPCGYNESVSGKIYENFPSFENSISLTLSTVSDSSRATLSNTVCPSVVSNEPWLEALYVLHESGDPSESEENTGCTSVLRRILTTSLINLKARRMLTKDKESNDLYIKTNGYELLN
jgi:hypothetical protein